MASRYILAALLLSVAAFAGSSAYAQEVGMKQPTSEGVLDVMIEPNWEETINETTEFKVTFLQPGTETVQVHIDYDFIIKQGDEVVFKASTPVNQPLLHTETGIVTIPYQFEENGSYTIEVPVSGINFVPINTETAVFGINVVPEFPIGMLGIVAAVMGAAVVMHRLKR